MSVIPRGLFGKPIRHPLTDESAVEVLLRLYARNKDEKSSDFEILTSVQSAALYRILEAFGRKPGKGWVGGRMCAPYPDEEDQ